MLEDRQVNAGTAIRDGRHHADAASRSPSKRRCSRSSHPGRAIHQHSEGFPRRKPGDLFGGTAPCPLFAGCVRHATDGSGAGNCQIPATRLCRPVPQRVHNELQDTGDHRFCLILRELGAFGDAINTLCLGRARLSPLSTGHTRVGPPLSPTKKRMQTLPLSERLSSCALSVPFYHAASQDRPVSCVLFGHTSAGQSYIGGMLDKWQPSVNIF